LVLLLSTYPVPTSINKTINNRGFMPRLILLTLLATCPLYALEWSDIRLGPRASAGTAGFEFGAFAEFDIIGGDYCLRPELFIHDRKRPAAAFAFLWRATFARLAERHALHMGPRVAFHNGKDDHDPRGEIAYMGAYTMPIPPLSPDTKHHINMFAALGIMDADGTEVAATFGAGYFFAF
jgi:hypothetical protein